MNFDDELILEKQYTEICEKLAAHKLPAWDGMPDIDLYMDQVVAVLEKALEIYSKGDSEENKVITPSIINNYVKLKVIPAPVKKRYGREHLALLIMICILKQTLSISSIVKLLSLQLEKKSVEQLYREFCAVYESVIPFAAMEDVGEEIEDLDRVEAPDDLNAFILKSAILSTAGKYICEGVLMLFPEVKNIKEEKKKD